MLGCAVRCHAEDVGTGNTGLTLYFMQCRHQTDSMSCCGGGKGAIDPRTNKPIVTVSNAVDGTTPTSAADAAKAYGTQDAAQRLPPFFFTKMPDEEPVLAQEQPKVQASSAGAAVQAAAKDEDVTRSKPRDQNNEPQMVTPDKAIPAQRRVDDTYTAAVPQAPAPPGALPALLQVVQVKGTDGQPQYEVVEATPPPPMRVAA